MGLPRHTERSLALWAVAPAQVPFAAYQEHANLEQHVASAY